MADTSPKSDVSSKLFAWILGGVGTLIVYSAYKSQNPINILKGVRGEPIYSPPNGDDPEFGIPEDPNVGGVVRLRRLANREIRPELRSLPGGGMLDKSAHASILRINSMLGYPVRNVGTYRTYAEQAAAHARDPEGFAPPGKSLHEVGLAIDVHAAQKSNAELVAAFTQQGWHRARWGPGTRNDEDWHWSYGVVG